jgi:nitroreductase
METCMDEGQQFSVHNLIKSRVSIRSYQTKPIPISTIFRILESACRAPSTANMQCWRFIIVDDPAQKRRIAEACAHKVNAQACEDAPYVIALCADPVKSGIKNGIDYWLFDCALAMENLLLAAQGEGLATCVIAWYDAKKIAEALHLPEKIKLVAITPLGMASEVAKPTPRKSLKEVAFQNMWATPLQSGEESNLSEATGGKAL